MQGPPAKRSTIDKQMNNTVAVMFVIFAACVLGFGIGGGVRDVRDISSIL